MQPTILAQFENADGKTTISLERGEDGSVRLFYHDVGAAAARTYGNADYEAWVQVPEAALAKLAFVLLVDKLTGKADALTQLRTFCEAHGVAFDVGVWT
jgi:hypothetical protein